MQKVKKRVTDLSRSAPELSRIVELNEEMWTIDKLVKDTVDPRVKIGLSNLKYMLIREYHSIKYPSEAET